MRKVSLFLIILCASLCGIAQSECRIDESGVMLYQYNRSCVRDSVNSGTLWLDFSFVNGPYQQAISYRQERMNGKLRWLNTDKGHLKKESIVDAVTVNLAPHDSISWHAVFENVPCDKTGTLVEAGALLLMRDDLKVEKIIFEEKKCK